jgi:hypothetical protein
LWEALKILPKELRETYDEAMQRIEIQCKDDVALANQVLSWISYAKRPLTACELQHALATTAESTDIDVDDLIDEGDMISVCAGLVTIEQGSGIIRLVHYTTQEYFEDIRHTRFPGAELEISRTCLTYFAFDVFDAPCHDERAGEERLKKYPFGSYVAGYWAEHTRGDPENEGEIQNAVASAFRMPRWISMVQIARSGWLFLDQAATLEQDYLLLDIVSENGLATMCKRLLDGSFGENDGYVEDFFEDNLQKPRVRPPRKS